MIYCMYSDVLFYEREVTGHRPESRSPGVCRGAAGSQAVGQGAAGSQAVGQGFAKGPVEARQWIPSGND